MTTAYKFYYSDIQDKVNEYSKTIESKGGEPMAQFVNSILSVIKYKNGYKKFGVYWFAIKTVLSEHAKKDLGQYTVKWLEDEYKFAVDGMGYPKTMTPAMILVAGYTFAENEGYLSDGLQVPPIDEYDIDGTMWNIEDEDML